MRDAELSAGLAVRPPEPYVYKSALKRGLAAGLDALGGLFAPPAAPLDWGAARSVGVLRLDHLGDLVFAFPALRALRRGLPKARITLYVGPWGREIAALCGEVHEVRVVEASWFKRPQRTEWPWAEIRALGDALRGAGHDLGVELRGDLRHHLALKRSGIPRRLGHALTAGSFLLTHPGRHDNALHEIDQNLHLLGQYGLPVPAPGKALPELKLPPAALDEAARVRKALKLAPGFVAVQAACGSQAKRWMPERWAEWISVMSMKRRVVLLGSASEREEMKALAARVKGRKPALAAGRLSLGGLAAFLESARMLASVDSGPAHLAAAVGTPVLGLYSGTNLASQWGVRGKRSRILRAATPCSPCELTACPYGNECMRRLSVGQALAAARGLA